MKSAPVLRFGSLLLCGLLGAGLAGSALAQSSSGAEGLLNDKWVVNLGGFVYGTSLDARLNGQSSTTRSIDIDSTFGKADDATRVRADVLWRITPEHRLSVMYFDNAVTRSKVLANDVEWGDYTFLAGSRADFTQSFEAIALAYEYASCDARPTRWLPAWACTTWT